MAEGQDRDSGNSDKPAGSFAGSVPSISLPKGDGAIRGIGDKFAASPATGTDSILMPIANISRSCYSESQIVLRTSKR
jgi:hypothetical protein